jgi:hypothetical protein
MLSLPLLGTDCLSFPPLGGPGPPSTPSPMLTPFPSDPMQQPASTLGTILNRRLGMKFFWPFSFLFREIENNEILSTRTKFTKKQIHIINNEKLLKSTKCAKKPVFSKHKEVLLLMKKKST